MNKKDLRLKYLAKRNQLGTKELIQLDSLLLIQFQQIPVAMVDTLLSYWPIHEKSEVNTHLMVDYLSFLNPGLQLAFPVIDTRGKIFKPVLVNDDTQYLANSLGIEEPLNGSMADPEDIDLVFVPLLAFDRKGFRVGYGKGFYDRFLKTCREDVLKIGFSYFEPEPSIDDINEYDVPLSICITPNNIYEF